MSKKETPMIRKYWKETGGTLVEEFLAVKVTNGTGKRLIDAVIVLNSETRIAAQKDVDIEGKDIIIVQAKAKRLGMPLMGQILFSAELMKQFKPASIRSIALCNKDDEVLRPLLEKYPGMEVVILP
jgi:hypothetical protein